MSGDLTNANASVKVPGKVGKVQGFDEYWTVGTLR